MYAAWLGGDCFAADAARSTRLGGDREPVPDAARRDHHVIAAADDDLALDERDHPATRESAA